MVGEPQETSALHEPPPSLAAMRALIKREGARPKPTTHTRELLRYVLEEQRAMSFILATALLEAVLSLISPWVAARAIDVALPNAAPSMLTLLAIGTVASVVFTAWTGWLHEKASVVLQERLVTRTQRELMQRYLRTGFSDLQTTEFGATRVTFSVASTLVKSITRSVIDVITQAATALATLFWLGSYSPGLATAILAAALVTAALAVLLSVREMRFAKMNMGASSQAEQLLHSLLRAVTTLRVFHATDRLVDRWIGLSQKQAQQAVAMETTRLARTALLLGARQFVTWTSTVWLVNQTLDGTLTLGGMTSCSMLVGQVLAATVNVTQSAMSTWVQRPAAKRVDALCSASQQGVGRRVSAKKHALRTHNVKVDNLWYRYQPTAPWVLRDHCCEYAGGPITFYRRHRALGNRRCCV